MHEAPPDVIELVVNDRPVRTSRGAVLLNVIQANDFLIETSCGGRGTCHLCRVTITEGRERLPSPNPIEKKALGNVLLAQGMRLSCQITVQSPFAVRLPVFETAEQRRERIRMARERKLR